MAFPVRALAACLLFFLVPAQAQPVTAPPVAARAFVLVDALSGQTLATANEDDRIEPASLTKVMTAYVAFRAVRDGGLDPAKPITVSERAAAAAGTRMFVSRATSVSFDDLVKGLVVQSANDAAVAIAEAVAGSEAAFVERMNAQAARLGLANSHFANATGQPAEGHHSTARDLATLCLALVRDFPQQYPVFAVKEFSYNRMSQASRNRLLWTDSTVDGIATGFTEASGYGLAASARRGERRLIAVLVGARSDMLRATEGQKLLNFGFQAFETRRLYKAREAVASPTVYKGTQPTVALGFERDVWLTLPRDRFGGIRAVLETRQPMVAPLAAGQKAGIMKIMRGASPVAEFPVVALEEVPIAGFLSRGWDTLKLLLRSDP